jgi:hypothetical protein
MESTQLAMETLINIAHRLEIYGTKRLQSSCSYYLEELPRDIVGIGLLKLKMTSPMSAITHDIYCQLLSQLLPIIIAYITTTTMINRFFILRGLELLNKLQQLSDNNYYFQDVPMELISALVRLLYVLNTRNEIIIPESYQIMGDPFGRSRPPLAPVIVVPPTNTTSTVSAASISSSWYSAMGENTFFHDQIDLELRDAALEELRTLCLKSSRKNALKLLTIDNAVMTLYQIATYKSLLYGKGDATANKAITILSVLSSIPEATVKLKAIQTELIVAACSDQESAGMIICTSSCL